MSVPNLRRAVTQMLTDSTKLTLERAEQLNKMAARTKGIDEKEHAYLKQIAGEDPNQKSPFTSFEPGAKKVLLETGEPPASASSLAGQLDKLVSSYGLNFFELSQRAEGADSNEKLMQAIEKFSEQCDMDPYSIAAEARVVKVGEKSVYVVSDGGGYFNNKEQLALFDASGESVGRLRIDFSDKTAALTLKWDSGDKKGQTISTPGSVEGKAMSKAWAREASEEIEQGRYEVYDPKLDELPKPIKQLFDWAMRNFPDGASTYRFTTESGKVLYRLHGESCGEPMELALTPEGRRVDVEMNP